MFNQITRNVFEKKLTCSPLVLCIHFSLSSRFLARSRIHDTIKRRVGGVDLLSLSPRALFFYSVRLLFYFYTALQPQKSSKRAHSKTTRESEEYFLCYFIIFLPLNGRMGLLTNDLTLGQRLVWK